MPVTEDEKAAKARDAALQGALTQIERQFGKGTVMRNSNLRRAQLAFAATWTGEWAFTVALGVVAFRDGGATGVGVVGFIRMAPAALLSPVGTALADRFACPVLAVNEARSERA